mgnify:FL=1
MILVLTRLFKISLVLVSMPGCTFLPLPLTYMSSAKSGIDAVQMLRGEQTINDHIISRLTGKICKTSDWIAGQDFCKEIYKPAPVTVEELPPLD